MVLQIDVAVMKLLSRKVEMQKICMKKKLKVLHLRPERMPIKNETVNVMVLILEKLKEKEINMLIN